MAGSDGIPALERARGLRRWGPGAREDCQDAQPRRPSVADRDGSTHPRVNGRPVAALTAVARADSQVGRSDRAELVECAVMAGFVGVHGRDAILVLSHCVEMADV